MSVRLQVCAVVAALAGAGCKIANLNEELQFACDASIDCATTNGERCIDGHCRTPMVSCSSDVCAGSQACIDGGCVEAITGLRFLAPLDGQQVTSPLSVSWAAQAFALPAAWPQTRLLVTGGTVETATFHVSDDGGYFTLVSVNPGQATLRLSLRDGGFPTEIRVQVDGQAPQLVTARIQPPPTRRLLEEDRFFGTEAFKKDEETVLTVVATEPLGALTTAALEAQPQLGQGNGAAWDTVGAADAGSLTAMTCPALTPECDGGRCMCFRIPFRDVPLHAYRGVYDVTLSLADVAGNRAPAKWQSSRDGGPALAVTRQLFSLSTGLLSPWVPVFSRDGRVFVGSFLDNRVRAFTSSAEPGGSWSFNSNFGTSLLLAEATPVGSLLYRHGHIGSNSAALEVRRFDGGPAPDQCAAGQSVTRGALAFGAWGDGFAAVGLLVNPPDAGNGSSLVAHVARPDGGFFCGLYLLGETVGGVHAQVVTDGQQHWYVSRVLLDAGVAAFDTSDGGLVARAVGPFAGEPNMVALSEPGKLEVMGKTAGASKTWVSLSSAPPFEHSTDAPIRGGAFGVSGSKATLAVSTDDGRLIFGESETVLPLGGLRSATPMLGEGNLVYLVGREFQQARIDMPDRPDWRFSVAGDDGGLQMSAIDCNRAHPGGPGRLALVAPSGTLWMVLVDSPRLSDGAWPTAFHDPQGTNNLSTPVSCP